MVRKVLICTVGGSYQPIVTAIETLEPDYIFFVCTQGPQGSEYQITGKGKIIKASSDQKSTLPNIPTQKGLQADCYELVHVEADNLDSTYNTLYKTIDSLDTRFPGAELIADYTGGTKGMSVALVLAALEHDLSLHLVTGPRPDLVKVADNTQWGVPVDYESIRMRREIRLGLAAWEQYGYSQAVETLKNIKRTSNPVLQKHHLMALNLSKAFDHWDRFDHAAAYGILSSCAEDVGREYSNYLRILGLFMKGGPAREPALICDLWLNALRRAAQGRYDDAVSRAYRVLEWVAQWLLLDRCKVDTCNLPKDFIPDTIGIIPNHKNRLQAPLFLAWQLVEAKTDTNMAQFFRENKKNFQKKLEIRNESILAHGFTPVDFNRWSEILEWMDNGVLPAFLKDARHTGLKMPAQLPSIYKFEV